MTSNNHMLAVVIAVLAVIGLLDANNRKDASIKEYAQIYEICEGDKTCIEEEYASRERPE